MNQDTPSGILNIDKPSGLSSHDVVVRIRAATSVRRVGHAGTLDPLATGVLVVCVGRAATRVVEYLMDEPKTYRTTAQLGVVTDTFDAEGQILASTPVDLSRQDVERALEQFRGTIEQVPPMYSAVKHHGKPLYRLARSGIEVERKARTVEIYGLSMIAWNDEGRQPRFTLEVECSPGTYIRALVHDLGQVLGCGASVTGLTRLASGRFQLEDAVSLERVLQLAGQGRAGEIMIPVDEALADRFPALRIGEEEARRLCSGQPVEDRQRRVQDEEIVRVYGPEGRFLAIATRDAEEDVWRPEKVFVSPYAGPPPSHDT